MEHLLKRCGSSLWRWRYCIVNKHRAFCTVNTASSSSSPDDESTARTSDSGDGERGETVTTSTNGDSDGYARGEDRRETVIDRLRRLSMTPADEYELSSIAQEKAKEMAQVRSEAMKRGEQWKWDQRNLRPGGPPPRQYGGYNNSRRNDNFGGYGGMRRSRYEEEEEEEEYETEGRYSRQNRFEGGDNRRTSWRQQRPSYNSRREDTIDDADDYQPDNYEMEMQKLRERMQQTKIKKEALASKIQSQDGGSERNVDHISSSSYNEQYEPMASSGSNEKIAITLNEYDKNYELYNHQEREGEATAPPEYSPDYAVNFKLAENDPDTFGNLSFGASALVTDTVGEAVRNELLEDEKKLSLLHEEEEEDDTRFIPPYGQRWTTVKLVGKVRQLLKEKKLKEAVDTFLGVLKQGGFDFEERPLTHHFHVLINECAKAGYVEMAFRLYNLMKKRGYKEKIQTTTNLLNACANSPWNKETNMDKIDKLMYFKREAGLDFNLIHYHALIKAYGRMGETIQAFHVVDKMIEESRIEPITETFNMLLQACITDKNNGFRYALVTWRKMQSMQSIRPDIFSYNLLLRAIRECGIEVGDADLMGITNTQKPLQIGTSEPVLPVIVTEEDSNRLLSVLIPDDSTPNQIVLENLGEPTTLDVKTLFHSLKFRKNRLAVFGGVRGIALQMVRDKVGPNLKTLTELLSLARANEITDVLQLLTTYKIKPDVAFFTQAIQQCYDLNEHKMAQDMLKLMNNVYHITPDIVTWCVLSSGCRTWMEAKTLLAEMDSACIIPSIQLLAPMLSTAMKNFDPRFVLHVMQEIKMRKVAVNEKLLLRIDDFIKTTQKGVVSHEMGKEVQPKKLANAVERNPDFGEHFGLLKMRYKTWLEGVDVKIEPVNPWKADFDYFRVHRKHKPFEADDRQYESLIDASGKN